MDNIEKLFANQAFVTKYGIGRGVPLRDYFAAAALPTVLTVRLEVDNPARDAAVAAYIIADAMLAEREAE